MASKSTASQVEAQYIEKYNPVKSLLISQPKPEDKSPYFDMEQKWNLKIDWRPFIQVAPVSEKNFVKTESAWLNFLVLFLIAKELWIIFQTC